MRRHTDVSIFFGIRDDDRGMGVAAGDVGGDVDGDGDPDLVIATAGDRLRVWRNEIGQPGTAALQLAPLVRQAPDNTEVAALAAAIDRVRGGE